MRLVALDLVRFFAAMSVMVYHYTVSSANHFETLSNFSQFGYLGVPIFFIISGYVIALSANNRSAYEFAVSRFTRLYPAFWAGIAFTLIVTYTLTTNTYSIGQILANLTMLNDYMGFDDIDTIYWTLHKEIQFYACIFLLVFFNLFKHIKIWLSIWLLITILFLAIRQPFFMGWFITPEYSSLFIAGISFYLIHKQGVQKFNLFILFTSLIISSIYAYNDALNFMIKPTTQEQVIAVVLILSFHLFFYLLVTNKICMRKNQFYLILGALTYPLYLIHSVAGHAIINGPLKFMSKGSAVLVTIVLMIFFAYLIHVLIERKIATKLKARLIGDPS